MQEETSPGNRGNKFAWHASPTQRPAARQDDCMLDARTRLRTSWHTLRTHDMKMRAGCHTTNCPCQAHLLHDGLGAGWLATNQVLDHVRCAVDRVLVTLDDDMTRLIRREVLQTRDATTSHADFATVWCLRVGRKIGFLLQGVQGRDDKLSHLVNGDVRPTASL